MRSAALEAGQRHGFFYGWLVVAVALVIIALGVGLMVSLGVFMEPLETAMGWRRGQIARASLYGWLAFGIFSFVFGALSDRFGTRLIVMVGGGLFGFGMIALSRTQTLWHLYLFYGLLVGGGIGAFMVPLTSTVTRWFIQRRGLMVAVTNCGIGLGGMLLAPLTRYLIMTLGWRVTFLIYGLLVWSVVLPLSLLIRNRPQDMGLLPYRTPAVDAVTKPDTVPATSTFALVLATPAFWLIAVVHFLCCAAHSGPIFHMVSAVIDNGVDKLAAATVFAVASLASVPGRLGTGILADRYGSKRVLIVWLSMQATAILLYGVTGGFGGFMLLAVYFGVAYGGVMPLYAVLARDYFGAQAMGASYGAIFLLSCFGMGLGAWLGGRIFDGTGTYEMMYVTSAILGGCGALLAIGLRPPMVSRGMVPAVSAV